MVWSGCSCHMMTAQYPCDFTGASLTQCCNLAIAVQVQYNYLKSWAYNHCAIVFVPNDHPKSCDLRKISAQPSCGASSGNVQCFYKTIEARPLDPTAPVKPNDIYGLRAAATKKWEFSHTSTGAINSLQAIRKLGITLLQKHFSIYITHIHSA